MSETNKEELEDTRLADEEDPPFFPDEEIGEELPEETEEKQPSLFEGDKVYNALHTALTDINDSIKRIQKAIDSKRVELQVCETRKKEIQEAIEVYEKQRQEAE